MIAVATARDPPGPLFVHARVHTFVHVFAAFMAEGCCARALIF